MKLGIVCFLANSGPVVIDPFSPRIDSYCLLVCFVLYPENPAWQSWGWGPQNDKQTEVRLPLHFLHLRSCQGCQLSEELSEPFFPLLAFGRGCGSWRGFYTFSGDSCYIQVLLKCKSMCLKHSQAKQYQNVQVWSRERFIESQPKRWVAHVLKNVRLPKSSQQCPFLGMVREGCGELLQTSWFQSLCSSVRSWSGNHVPINLYQLSVFLHMIRKFPRLNQTLRGPSSAERRQSSVGSSFRVGSPEILSSCHPWGSQASRSQLALRFLRLSWQLYRRPHRLHLLPLSHRGGGNRERVIAAWRPEPSQWVALGKALEPCRTQPSACSLGLWAHWLAQGWRAGGQRPGSTSDLIHWPRTNFPLTVGCIAH